MPLLSQRQFAPRGAIPPPPPLGPEVRQTLENWNGAYAASRSTELDAPTRLIIFVTLARRRPLVPHLSDDLFA